MKEFGKKATFAVVCAGLLFAFAECALRLYLVCKQGASFRDPARLIIKAYPTLAPLYDACLDTNRFHILLLGGSTLHKEFGDVAGKLAGQLERRGMRNCVIHNVSQLAHTSRDSWFKYEALRGRHFAAVVVYHGINELRANNCPADVFRPDYSHYGWYELWNVFDRHRDAMRYSVIPYCADYAVHRLRQALWPKRYLPEHRPLPEWVKYGGDIKTAASFESNVRSICKEAERRGEKALLLTYAHYLPAGYSQEAFLRGELDYAAPRLPVELWGDPANVLKGLRVHNEVIRKLAASLPGAGYFDMAAFVPHEGRYFNDICHFSDAGCDRFAEGLAGALEAAYRQRAAGFAERGGGL